TMSLPYADCTIDVVFASSIFLNLPPEEIKNYLSEISHVLKIEGQCLLVYFLWNPSVETLIKSGKTDIKVFYNCAEYKALHNVQKEKAIAHHELNIYNWHGTSKLPISEILYGSWSGSSTESSYHDIVLAKKRAVY